MHHHHHHEGHRGHHHGSKGYCICPKCGYSIEHKAGIPCRTEICPTCKTSLIRSETKMEVNKHEENSNKNVEQLKKSAMERKIQYPKVVEDKCRGCQSCISICPRETIVLKDNKAFVITDNCSNCRVCMRVCPENAFVLE